MLRKSDNARLFSSVLALSMSDSPSSLSSNHLPSARGAKAKRSENKSTGRSASSSVLGKHEFLRLLGAALDKPLATETGRFSERLTRNLEFTHSLKLSEVPAVLKRIDTQWAGTCDSQEAKRIASQVDAALQRVQKAIRQTITQSFEADAAQARIPLPSPKVEQECLSLAVYLTFYQAHQQEMSAKIQGLRRYLRECLAPVSARMAQLVYLDSTLEETIGLPLRAGFQNTAPVLQVLISNTEQSLPGQAAEHSQESMLKPFFDQLRQLLFAECDLRLQPVIGLIEAFKQEVDQ